MRAIKIKRQRQRLIHAQAYRKISVSDLSSKSKSHLAHHRSAVSDKGICEQKMIRACVSVDVITAISILPKGSFLEMRFCKCHNKDLHIWI